jgi:hypothetical protein
MQKIQLPADLATKLAASDEPVELCDEAGTATRVAVPLQLYRELVLARAEAATDPAVLERARREPGGMTTAEAVAYLTEVAARHPRP